MNSELHNHQAGYCLDSGQQANDDNAAKAVLAVSWAGCPEVLRSFCIKITLISQYKQNWWEGTQAPSPLTFPPTFQKSQLLCKQAWTVFKMTQVQMPVVQMKVAKQQQSFNNRTDNSCSNDSSLYDSSPDNSSKDKIPDDSSQDNI